MTLSCGRARLARREPGPDRSSGARRLEKQDALSGFQVSHFQPFDPVHKRTEADVQDRAMANFKVSKGAPQVILELAANATRSSRRSTRPSTSLRCAAFVRWGWRERTETARGSSWRAAAVRSAARRFRSRRLPPPANGCRGENGHRRPGRHRQRDRPHRSVWARTLLDASVFRNQLITRPRNSMRPSNRPTASRRCFPSTSITSSKCCRSTATSSG